MAEVLAREGLHHAVGEWKGAITQKEEWTAHLCTREIGRRRQVESPAVQCALEITPVVDA